MRADGWAPICLAAAPMLWQVMACWKRCSRSQPPELINLAEHWICRKQVLGGLTREYDIAALPASVATGKRRSPPESYFRAPQGLVRDVLA
jgi:hypothetical protein